MPSTDTYPRLLTVGEVARILGVKPPAVRAWESAGKLTASRTPGNQRRFLESEVRALLPETPAVAGSSPSPGDDPAETAA